MTATPPPLPSRRPARTPVLLSAMVYPGAGQFMQGRRRAGFLFVVLFTLPFVWLGAVLLYPPFARLIEFQRTGQMPLTAGIYEGWGWQLLVSGVLSVIVYVWNVADAMIFPRRKMGSNNSSRH